MKYGLKKTNGSNFTKDLNQIKDQTTEKFILLPLKGSPSVLTPKPLKFVIYFDFNPSLIEAASTFLECVADESTLVPPMRGIELADFTAQSAKTAKKAQWEAPL